MRLRPSRLGIAFRCPGSLSLPEVERLSDAAESGKKRHAWLAKHPEVGTGALNADTECETEWPVEFQGIKGTADLVYAGPLIGVADYKTAGQDQGDPAESEQLLHYACAVDASEAAFIYVEDSGPDGKCRVTHVRRSPVTPEMRQDFAERLAKLQSAPPVFATGPHCTFCPSATCCPSLRNQVEMVVAGQELTLTPKLAGAAWERIRAVRAACDMAENAVRALVAHGPIPLPSGKILAEIEVARETILAEEALKWLPELEDKIKMSLAKADVSQVQLVHLRKLGATKVQFVKQIREVKKEAQNEEDSGTATAR